VHNRGRIGAEFEESITESAGNCPESSGAAAPEGDVPLSPTSMRG
jgi:hypothetical protein